MKRRGRPDLKMTHSQKLAQTLTIVKTFDEAQQGGEKRDAAILIAAETARRLFPALRASTSEVKRVLAMWRGKHANTVFLLREEVPQRQSSALIVAPTSDPETLKAAEELARCLGGQPARSIVGYVGEKPVIERHNRAEKPRNRKKPKP